MCEKHMWSCHRWMGVRSWRPSSTWAPGRSICTWAQHAQQATAQVRRSCCTPGHSARPPHRAAELGARAAHTQSSRLALLKPACQVTSSLGELLHSMAPALHRWHRVGEPGAGVRAWDGGGPDRGGCAGSAADPGAAHAGRRSQCQPAGHTAAPGLSVARRRCSSETATASCPEDEVITVHAGKALSEYAVCEYLPLRTDACSLGTARDGS